MASKLHLTTVAEYVANLLHVNMRL